MRGLVLADLRHSLRIWGGSILILFTVQLCSMWLIGLTMVGITNIPVVFVEHEGVDPLMLQLTVSGMISALIICFTVFACVSSIVVRNVVNAIVYQRRRVMALWQLGGMTDQQLLTILRGQVALLSIVAFVIAAVIALPTAPWALSILRAAGLLIEPPMTTWGIYPGYAAGALLSFLLCIFAVRGASKELKAISPLEAIRSEGIRELTMSRGRWIRTIVFLALTCGFAIAAVTAEEPEGIGSGALLTAIFGIVAFNVGGPVFIVGLITGWTRLVPEHVSASWFLARKTLLAATARVVSTTGSIAFSVFLFTTLFSQQGAESDIASFILFAGFSMAVSVVGAVVAVFMSGQQREREIHLAELAGATPAQQKRQALFEAVIVVVTGSGVGLFFAFVSAVITQLTFVRFDIAAAGVNWVCFGGITLTLLVLNVIATVAPTMIAQAARDRIAVPE